jgi:hypothetical protein
MTTHQFMLYYNDSAEESTGPEACGRVYRFAIDLI